MVMSGDGGGADGLIGFPVVFWRGQLVVVATPNREQSSTRLKKILGKEATAEKKLLGRIISRRSLYLSMNALSLPATMSTITDGAAVVERGRGVPGSGDSWAKPNQVGANASHQQSP